MQQTICARNVNAYVHSTTFPESNEQCKNVKEHFCSSTLRYRYCYARPSASILYFYPWVAWFRRLRVPSITSIFSVFVLWPAFFSTGVLSGQRLRDVAVPTPWAIEHHRRLLTYHRKCSLTVALSFKQFHLPS